MQALLIIIILLSIKPVLHRRKTKQARKENQKVITSKQAAAAARLAENERKRLIKIEKENQLKKAQAEKKKLQKEQAEKEIDFILAQLTLLEQTVIDTREDYKKALEQYRIDMEMNSCGSVAVKLEVVQQHKEEKEKALKKMLSYENKLFQLNKKLSIAESILTRA